MNMETTQTYNGWANYETWNVALWINNEPIFEEWVKDFFEWYPDGTYEKFIIRFGLVDLFTGDKIAFDSHRLDHEELTAMLKELGGVK